MSQTGTLNFAEISPARFQHVLDYVSAKLGSTLTGNSGSATKLGVTVGWSYDGASNLALTVIRSSFLDPALADIESQLTELINTTS